MNKKLVFLFISISLLVSLKFCYLNVNADEIYYTNANNVSMTEEQYNFLGAMFWDGFQEYVPQSLFNKYLTHGTFNCEIEQVVHEDEPTRGYIHETNAKKLVISKACYNGFCDMSVTLFWKGTPNIKSYDVIGALLYGGVSLANGSSVSTYLGYSGGTITYTSPQFNGGGFGQSVKLRTSTTNMIISQSFDVVGTGVVYASYQHATQNITLATSKKYTVGFGGYGGVFHFYGSAVGVYDQMGGVDMVIS